MAVPADETEAAGAGPFPKHALGKAARLAVVVCTAAALGAAVAEFPGTIHRLQRRAADNAAQDFVDREIAGGNALVVSQAAVLDARRLIRPDQTYRVVTGSNLRGATDLTFPYIENFLTYFLMPRRPARVPSWIICYGCDVKQWGRRLRVVRDEGDGILIGRLRP